MASRHLLLVVLVLPLVACDCAAEPGGGGGPCVTSADCGGERVCVDGECTARLDTDGGGTDSTVPDCPAARACGDTCCDEGQACRGGFCCAPAEQCGGVCCPPDHACEADVCRLVCEEGRAACGEGAEARCCPAGDVCLAAECATPGDPCSETMRCPDGEYCEPTLGHCLPRITTGEECTYMPPVGEFHPTVEWAWTGDATVMPSHDQVMMAPMVANLDDDDGDGAVDADDVPDIVFNTFAGSSYYFNGVLRAIRGSDGARIWPTAAPSYETMPGAGVAIAELDPASPGPEVLTCSEKVGGTGCCDGTAGDLLVVSGADGSLIRRITSVRCGYSAPAVADMDGDGTPEIAVRYQVVHADGTAVFSDARTASTVGAPGDYVTMADLDGDGDLELVGGNVAFHHDGAVLWERTDNPDGFPAVADVDADGMPEVIVVSTGDHAIRALNGEDGSTVWGPVDVNQGRGAASPNGGGPPTIADFDGDGLPEIAAAGGYGYVVFEAEDGSPKWFRDTVDLSSRVTGSSVFDFDGDGAAEVVYNDEKNLRVYRGSDGTVLLEECSTSGTLWEYPVIVDVDNDDHAEIILMNNDYSGQTCLDGSPGRNGIRVFGDVMANWVRTRRIWNQHTYHVTNVNEDGTIPAAEVPNWTAPGLNNFRQNVQPDGLLDAPDLVPVDLALDTSVCPDEAVLQVRILNRGRAGAPSGIPVEIFDVDPGTAGAVPIATVATTRPLLPGESQLLRITLPLTITPGTPIRIWVTVNTGDSRLDTLHECREDNNTGATELYCPPLG